MNIKSKNIKNLHKNFLKKNNNAVTSVISLILILMIYFSSIGVIFLWGIPAIDSMKQEAQKAGAENNFEILNSLVDDLIQSGPGSCDSINIENSYGSGELSIDPSGDRFVTYYTVDEDYELDVYDIGEDQLSVNAKRKSTGYEIDIDNVDIYLDTCFLAGTKVLMADGSEKNIEDIRPGDKVISYDFELNDFIDSEVTFLHYHEDYEMDDYYLKINNDLCVTPNHKFYTNRGWIRADELKRTDRLFSYETNNFYPILSLINIYEKNPSYDLSIKKFNNFLVKVNNNFIIVHNIDPETITITAVQDIDIYNAEYMYASLLKFSLQDLINEGNIRILSATLGLFVTDKSNDWDGVISIKKGGDDWSESSDLNEIIDNLPPLEDPDIESNFDGVEGNYWYTEDIGLIIDKDFRMGKSYSSIYLEHPAFPIKVVSGFSNNQELSVGCFFKNLINLKFFDRTKTSCEPILKVEYLPNQPPATPSNPTPENLAQDIGINQDLAWECSDPEHDPLTYDIYFATSLNELVEQLRSEIPHGTSNIPEYDPGLLIENTEYWWCVIAKDEGGQSSTVGWRFQTGSSTSGSPPSKPSDPNPESNANNVDINQDLSWTCTEPDGDPVTYDIYFATLNEFNEHIRSGIPHGTSNVPEYDPGLLLENTDYRWCVYAEDKDGGIYSNAWSFLTGSVSVNVPPNPPNTPVPNDGSTGVDINPTLSVFVYDADQDTMDVSFYGVKQGQAVGPLPLWGTVNDVASGQIASFTIPQDKTLDYLTTYEWYAIADDQNGETTQSDTWTFTTIDEPVTNNPPVVFLVDPFNGGNNVGKSSSTGVKVLLKAVVADNDDDPLLVKFYDGLVMAQDPEPIESQIVSNTKDGKEVSCWWEDLTYESYHEWYVTVDDYQVPEPIESAPRTFTTLANEVPVANDNSYSINSEEAVEYTITDLLDDDSDPDGHNLIITGVEDPDGLGFTEKVSDTVVKYYSEGYSGITSFEYDISDGFGGSDTGLVTITITESNTNPYPADQPSPTHNSIDQGTVSYPFLDVDVELSVHVEDPDGIRDPLEVTFYNADGFAIGNTHNNVVSNSRVYQTWSGIPFETSCSWYVIVKDPGNVPIQSDIWTFTTTSFDNTPPVANNDVYTIPAYPQSDYEMDVLDNDNDDNGHDLTIIDIPREPTKGTVTHDGSHVYYTPNKEELGSDSFEYTIKDALGDTDTAQVTVTITNEIADFLWYDLDGNGDGKTISFTALYYMDSYEWDFDYDGSNPTIDATDKTVSHTYSDYESHIVYLKVTDELSNEYESTQEVYASIGTISSVKPYTDPTVFDFYVDVPYEFIANPSVDNENEPTCQRSYLWDFDGDKEPDYTDPNAYDYDEVVTWEKTFDEPGIYFIRYKPNYVDEGFESKWSKPYVAIVKEKYRSPEGFQTPISSNDGEITITRGNSYDIKIETGDKLEGTVKIDLFCITLPDHPSDVPFATIWILDLGSLSFSINTNEGRHYSIFENNAILSGLYDQKKYISKIPDLNEVETDNEVDLLFNVLQIREGSSTFSISGEGLFKFDVEVEENPINDAWSEDAQNIKMQIIGDNNQSWEDYLIRECGFEKNEDLEYEFDDADYEILEYQYAVKPVRFQFFVSKVKISLEGYS